MELLKNTVIRSMRDTFDTTINKTLRAILEEFDQVLYDSSHV